LCNSLTDKCAEQRQLSAVALPLSRHGPARDMVLMWLANYSGDSFSESAWLV
jgi:hypothetical protein